MNEERLLRCYGCRAGLAEPAVCPSCVKPSCARCLRAGGCRACLDGPRLADAVAVMLLALVLLGGTACDDADPTGPTGGVDPTPHTLTIPGQEPRK